MGCWWLELIFGSDIFEFCGWKSRLGYGYVDCGELLFVTWLEWRCYDGGTWLLITADPVGNWLWFDLGCGHWLICSRSFMQPRELEAELFQTKLSLTTEIVFQNSWICFQSFDFEMCFDDFQSWYSWNISLLNPIAILFLSHRWMDLYFWSSSGFYRTCPMFFSAFSTAVSRYPPWN